MARRRKKSPDSAGLRTDGTVATNRRARYEYHLLDTFEAGLVLRGSEIKSVRQGKVDISSAYVRIQGGEAWMVNAHIAPYDAAGIYGQHDPLRDKKLLLNRREIDFLASKSEQDRLTIVVTSIYVARGVAKAGIALARGKRMVDRRETIRRRDHERDMARAVRRSM